MSNGSDEKKFTPRYARSSEELIFYTDTSDYDYPIYLLPNFEVRIKKRPADVEKFAVFHLKSKETIEMYDEYADFIYMLLPKSKDVSIDSYIARCPQLKDIVKVVEDVNGIVHLRTYKLTYEVYKGDYSEFVAEADATVVMMYITPPYSKNMPVDQKFAITYTTLKRIVSKLSPEVSQTFQRYAYIDKLADSRGRLFPIIKLKICMVSDELRRAFDEVRKWLEDLEDVEEAANEEPQPQIEIELPELKPKELEVEPVQPLPKPTAVETEKSEKTELVKVYLLSMRLPSKYLLQKVEVKENEEVRKWEGLAAQIASRLESIRRAVYEMIEKIFAHVEEYGVWVAVTEEAVKEAQNISEWVRTELSKLPINQVKSIDIDKMYSVRAIPVYLEPDDAKELLSVAIAHLSDDVEELSKRIEEAEEQKKKSALKRLENDLQYKKALLEAFRKYLSSI
jgi:DNA-directed RNA polymerase subunit L